MTKRQEELRSAAIFVLPAVAILAVFIVYPAIATLVLSLFDGEGGFVGLRNFITVLSHEHTLNLDRFPGKSPPWGSLIHNGIWIVVHLPVTLILGIILANVLYNIKGGPTIKAIIFLGMVIPMIVGGVMIRFLFDSSSGVIPHLLRTFGAEGVVTRTWTAYPQTSLAALILGSILLWTGFSLTMHASGLATISKDYYEAADVDGAGVLTKFFRITIPMLAPVTSVVIAMTLLWEIKIFDIVYAATEGGPGGSSMVLSFQMYRYAFRQLNHNLAATVATILSLFTLLVGVWLSKRNKEGT
ncbi:MAG: carbohydrate ABC transporter permease [Spirochaetaceae bacterium]